MGRWAERDSPLIFIQYNLMRVRLDPCRTGLGNSKAIWLLRSPMNAETNLILQFQLSRVQRFPLPLPLWLHRSRDSDCLHPKHPPICKHPVGRTFLSWYSPCHGRTFNMPAWPSIAPWRWPWWFARLAPFPQRKILRIPFYIALILIWEKKTATNLLPIWQWLESNQSYYIQVYIIFQIN